MQNFVSVRPPVISKFIKEREKEQANRFFKTMAFVVAFIAGFGFAVGLLTGWIFWG